MTTYRVEWEIDIEADTAQEAADKARAIQLDPQSIANVFSVLERDSLDDPTLIDLEEAAESAALTEKTERDLRATMAMQDPTDTPDRESWAEAQGEVTR